jgi:hypothetical protein
LLSVAGRPLTTFTAFPRASIANVEAPKAAGKKREEPKDAPAVAPALGLSGDPSLWPSHFAVSGAAEGESFAAAEPVRVLYSGRYNRNAGGALFRSCLRVNSHPSFVSIRLSTSQPTDAVTRLELVDPSTGIVVMRAFAPAPGGAVVIPALPVLARDTAQSMIESLASAAGAGGVLARAASPAPTKGQPQPVGVFLPPPPPAAPQGASLESVTAADAERPWTFAREVDAALATARAHVLHDADYVVRAFVDDRRTARASRFVSRSTAFDLWPATSAAPRTVEPSSSEFLLQPEDAEPLFDWTLTVCATQPGVRLWRDDRDDLAFAAACKMWSAGDEAHVARAEEARQRYLAFEA